MPQFLEAPQAMPWTARTVPHATLEVNQNCNISCYGCYKKKVPYNKDLDLVKREVSQLCGERQLESITILGGEPTLYPQLDEVVRDIAARGVLPFALTNGTTLTPEFLARMKAAGLVGFRIHIDRFQGPRPDFSGQASKESDMHALRAELVARCHRAGLDASLALTLYSESLPEVADIDDFCHRHGVTSVLYTLYTPDVNAGERDKALSLTNLDVLEHLRSRSGVLPSWFVPSTKDPKAFRWLIYYWAVTTDAKGNYSRLPFSPAHKVAGYVMPRLSRLVRGRYNFNSTLPASQVVLGVLLYALLSFSLPFLWKAALFLFAAARNGNIGFYRIVFQEGPTLHPDGSYDCCANCPDATVREGKIIPVCIADHVMPIG